MTPTECVSLVRLINARCPSMRLDDATPDAWYIDLRDIDATDAREAAITLSRRQAYIALHELLTEATAIERRRIGQQRAAELQAQIERENAGELHQRPVAALVAGQPMPSALMREQVSKHRRDITEADVAARTRVAEQREQARQELEQVRATAETGTE